MSQYNLKKFYTLPDQTKQKINQALITHVYQQIYLGQFTSVFCATIIFIGLYTAHDSNPNLKIWYIIFLAVAIARLVTAGIYLSKRYQISNYNIWRYIAIVGALLGGICWGFVGSFLFDQASIIQQTLIILILAGITAGAAPLLAAELTTSFVFVSAVLIPLTYELYYLADGPAYQLFAVTAIAYFLYLIILSVKLHRMIKGSITLKFENDSLLENLSLAKNQLEIINNKLTDAATHDPLTHAANRDLFQQKLNEAIERSKSNHKLVSLFFIDIDNFKTINDKYGHQIGDQLLLKIVERLRKNVREYDLISRLGGDELTIIFENISGVEAIHSIALQLIHALAKPVKIQNTLLTVTASIGISICPLDNEDADDLLNAADRAMYSAKNMGRNNFRFNSEQMNKKFLLPNLSNPATSSH